MADINVEVGARDVGYKRVIDDARRQIRDTQQEATRVTKTTNDELNTQAIRWGAVATAVVGVGAAIRGMIALKEEDNRSTRQLQNAIAGLNIDQAAYLATAQATIAALERKTNFSDVEQRRSLALLIGITQDADAALKLLPRALDTAALSGQGLTEVVRGLGRVATGQAQGLEALGLNFKKTAEDAQVLETAVENVSRSAESSTTALGASTAASGIAIAGTLGLLNDAFKITAGPGGVGFAVDFVKLYEQVFGEDDVAVNAEKAGEATQKMAAASAEIAESTGLKELKSDADAAGVSVDELARILDERAGGAAAAAKTDFERLQTEMANFAENLGGLFEPSFQSIASRLAVLVEDTNRTLFPEQGESATDAALRTQRMVTAPVQAVEAVPTEAFVGAAAMGVPGGAQALGVRAGQFLGDFVLPPGMGSINAIQAVQAARRAQAQSQAVGLMAGDAEFFGAAPDDRSLGFAGLPPGVLQGGGFTGIADRGAENVTSGGSGTGALRSALDSRNDILMEYQAQLAEDSMKVTEIVAKTPDAMGKALAPLPGKLLPAFSEGAKIAEQFSNDVGGSVNWIATQLGAGPIVGSYSSTLATAASVASGIVGIGHTVTDIFGAQAVNSALDSIGAFASDIGSFIGGFFAEGVTDFQGGVAVVGEKGPELVTLPRGASVIPHERSRAMVEAAQASGTVPGFAGGMGGGNEMVSDIASVASLLSMAGFLVPGVGLALNALNALGVFGSEEAWHEQFSSADDMVDTVFSQRGVTPPNVRQLNPNADQALFDAERDSVVSFFDAILDFHGGGVPMKEGLGRLHPGDVVATEPMLRQTIREEVGLASRAGTMSPRYFGPVTVVNGTQSLLSAQERAFSSVVS